MQLPALLTFFTPWHRCKDR